MTDSDCELAFEMALEENGEMWHVCTPGDKVELLCLNEDDYRYGMTNVALSAAEVGVTVYVDEIMGTHIHALLAGLRRNCIAFVDCYRYRLKKYNEMTGREVSLAGFECKDPIPITDFRMARTEACYVARNGYLEHDNYTPFTYPWGSASLLFNPFAESVIGIPYSDAPYRTKRLLEKKRPMIVPDNYRYSNGLILPASYSKYKTVETFFRDAHQYFSMVSKNWEAYSEISKRMGDNVIMTYEELASVARTISSRDYAIKQPSLLSPSQKLSLAKVLHSDYRATNTQLRSILKIASSDVDALFPNKH